MMAGTRTAPCLLPGLLLTAMTLQACSTNPLAAIDGPYIPPSQRAAQTAPARETPLVVPAEEEPELAVPTEETEPQPDIVVAQLPEPEPMPEPDPLPAPVPAPPTGLPTQPLVEPVAPPPAPSLSPYAAFHAHVLRRLGGGVREAMLLADPPSLDPALRPCRTLPPAVLIDLDPAGALLPTVGTPRGDRDLATYLADLRQRGVTVYWITGHGPGQAGTVRQRLAETGLDPARADPLIVTRFAGESKQARRQALGQTDCLLAILGDERSDFDELYDYIISLDVAAPLEQHVGNGWFLAPPAVQQETAR